MQGVGREVGVMGGGGRRAVRVCRGSPIMCFELDIPLGWMRESRCKSGKQARFWKETLCLSLLRLYFIVLFLKE